MAHKYNPFQPNTMVAPGIFVGRLEKIDTIRRSLFQAQNGNPQHFLIKGERGIGIPTGFVWCFRAGFCHVVGPRGLARGPLVFPTDVSS